MHYKNLRLKYYPKCIYLPNTEDTYHLQKQDSVQLELSVKIIMHPPHTPLNICTFTGT